ncbi:response regulator [Gilvibacter sp.]|uniref:response regulator n=1 Tax=Gilvibacter sp. TaxID=2729997 RepID=UPI003B51E510
MPNLIFRTNKAINSHDFPNESIVDLNLDYGKGIDYSFTELVKQQLAQSRYTNIFIPLFIGDTFSDLLGLRFALHIRTTPTLNQCSNIFIYGTENYGTTREHKLFDILKTKGVFLIDFSLGSIQKYLSNSTSYLDPEFLASELSKINMEIPSNYEDDHSIANEWAICRWSKVLGIEDDDIKGLTQRIDNQLYFKYLSYVYPTPESVDIEEEKLNIKSKGNILYVDDEADKGWFEIFAHIVGDLNEIYIDELGVDFKSLSKDDIIDKTLNKVIDDNIDLVILDFRLTESDFFANDITDITGFQLLKKLKSTNPGIQVLIFSATNKVWNLQSLLRAGADDFILKEGVHNSKMSDFTKNSIEKLVRSIDNLLRRKFLKEIFSNCKSIERSLRNQLLDFQNDYSDFINELLLQLKVISSSAQNIELSKTITQDVLFLNCYSFLELYKKYYLREADYQLVVGIDEREINRYKSSKGKIINDGKFIRNNSNDNPSWFNCMAALFIDYFGICEIDHSDIKSLNKVKNGRNNYIHGSKTHFNTNEVRVIMDLCVKIASSMKE